MPKLTGPDLKTIREGLLLSAQALADRLRHAELLEVGHVRTVQRWEEGSRPVPDDIARYVCALDEIVEEGAKHVALAAELAPSKFCVWVRYDEEQHCPAMDPTNPKAPHNHRLHSAMLERARRRLRSGGVGEFHLVAFRPESFKIWLRQKGEKDTHEARLEWARDLALGILSGKPAGMDPVTLAETEGVIRTPHVKR